MQSMDSALASANQNSTIGHLRPVPAPSWLRTGDAGGEHGRSRRRGASGAQAFFSRRCGLDCATREREVLARGELFSLEVEGQRVAGRVWGEGPTVFLMHGWGGHSGQMTPLVDPAVAAGFRVVALDLPATASRRAASRRSSISPRRWCRPRALFRPVHGLVAHSFGAAASTYAISSGLAVERAVFFAPPAGFESFWARFRAGVGVSQGIMDRMLHEAEEWLHVSFEGIGPVSLAPRMSMPAAGVPCARGPRGAVRGGRRAGAPVAGRRAASGPRSRASAHPARRALRDGGGGLPRLIG